MKADLQQQIFGTFRKLYLVLDQFDDSNIDTIPADSGWSAGLCTEHIIKATSGLDAIARKTEPANRAFDQKIPAIKSIFLDFNKKMKSPDFLEPTESKHVTATLLSALEKHEKQMLDLTENADLTLISLVFEVPGFGSFTIYESISFALIHMQRHTVQLENIHRKIIP